MLSNVRLHPSHETSLLRLSSCVYVEFPSLLFGSYSPAEGLTFHLQFISHVRIMSDGLLPLKDGRPSPFHGTEVFQQPSLPLTSLTRASQDFYVMVPSSPSSKAPCSQDPFNFRLFLFLFFFLANKL